MQRRWRESCAPGFGNMFAFTLLLLVPLMAHTQSAPKMMPADADPNWEVATVRPSNPDDERQTIRLTGRHLELKNQTVEVMLMAGYGLQKSQIVNAPDWVKKQHFDVDGVPDVEGQPNVQQFQAMLRKLLVERFQLKQHREQRDMVAFALKLAKHGPTLRNAANPASPPRQDVRGGEGYRTQEFTGTSMQDLTVLMIEYLDHPLIDQTGLKGRYDFTLKYTYDETRAPTDGSAPPNLFTAIQEQVGLKLEPLKAPVDVLVVDSLERPIAN